MYTHLELHIVHGGAAGEAGSEGQLAVGVVAVPVHGSLGAVAGAGKAVLHLVGLAQLQHHGGQLAVHGGQVHVHHLVAVQAAAHLQAQHGRLVVM